MYNNKNLYKENIIYLPHESRYMCKYRSRKTKFSSEMELYIRCNTNERPFIREFRHKSFLNNHLQFQEKVYVFDDKDKINYKRRRKQENKFYSRWLC